MRNANITYTIRKTKRAKKIRITVRGSGSVIVSAPQRAKKQEIEGFIKERQDWILKSIERARKSVDTSLAYRDRNEYLAYKEKARWLIARRIEELNRIYGFSYNKIYIKDLTSCWGSCSPKKNLNFNYKLLFLPPKLRDYIIVHELCHLREFNHSPRFWKNVSRIVPEYKELDKKIRRIEPGTK